MDDIQVDDNQESIEMRRDYKQADEKQNKTIFEV